MTDTLYYDGKCPLCQHEIKWMSRWTDDSLVLVDIHETKVLPKEKSKLLEILHLQTASGEWQLGLDATVSAWNHTPIGFLFTPLRWPLIKHVADKLYLYWAKQRCCRLT